MSILIEYDCSVGASATDSIPLILGEDIVQSQVSIVSTSLLPSSAGKNGPFLITYPLHCPCQGYHMHSAGSLAGRGTNVEARQVNLYSGTTLEEKKVKA